MTSAANTNSDDHRIGEHLANERTFLAWVRTGVATMGMGLVIAKTGFVMGVREGHKELLADYIGLMLALTGVFTIGLSLFFYLRTQQEIKTSTYKSRGWFAMIFAIIIMMLGLVIVWYAKQPSM